MKAHVSIVCLSALLIYATAQIKEMEEFSIKVGVEEVRVDAVVLDNKGRQVPDLTADDFEIYQNGKLQKVTSCVYISASRNRDKNIVSPEASKAEMLVSKPKLSKDKILRTIAFLIGASGADPRPYIRKFVESQMEPGDLVGFWGAGPPNFSSDKRELLARIGGIKGRFSCVDAAIGTAGPFAVADALMSGTSASQIFDMVGRIQTDEDRIRISRAEIAPIRYAIRALQDLPGKKYLILTKESIFSDSRGIWSGQSRLINEAADEAWRAGVVVSTWDYCNTQIANPNGRFNTLFKKTGGIYTDSNSFLYKGKPALDALSGYYLLSYIPPEKTFNSKNRDKYNRIAVRVKRPGTQVHSRDGFLASHGFSDFAAVPQTNTLQQAMYSPILYSDLKLTLSSGYAHAPASGYFLRSWSHLDAKDLTFTKQENGRNSISLELLASTSDSMGRIQDTKNFRYDFSLTDAEVSEAKKNGIDFKTRLPVQNPGNYYASAAIRDRASGKIGTGNQFIDIPDLSKGRLSISSIFIVNSIRDVSEIKLGTTRGGGDLFSAMRDGQGVSGSPALRTYKPNDSLDYLMIIYNAKNKEVPAPKLEFQSTLFKDGMIYSQEQPKDIDLSEMDEAGRIPILKTLFLDGKMDEGDYVLQLTVKDKPTPEKSRAARKPRIAVQALDFQIRKE
jgi:VWFA-related protein